MVSHSPPTYTDRRVMSTTLAGTGVKGEGMAFVGEGAGNEGSERRDGRAWDGCDDNLWVWTGRCRYKRWLVCGGMASGLGHWAVPRRMSILLYGQRRLSREDGFEFSGTAVGGGLFGQDGNLALCAHSATP